MDLRTWIEGLADDIDSAVEVAAGLLEEKPRTVRSWLYCERAPSFLSAMGIVLKSNLQVDFNGIYTPVMRKVSERAGV